jgi:elongator complex protein 3
MNRKFIEHMNINENLIKNLIKSRIKNQADLASFKRKISKKYRIPCPSNIELLKAYHNLVQNKRVKKSEILENLLKTRPIRSLSGIVNISVLTKPYPCPGKCLYCPIEKGIPKSYVSGEPAVERAKRLNYDPYLQVKKRIEMLENEGHPTDKIELRIVGGTWSYYPKRYQAWFIKRCFDAANNRDKLLRVKKPWQNNMSQLFRELNKEQRKNEKAKRRIVGLSIETRPDFINAEEIKWLRELGVTMVELGIQSIYDDVLKLNLRGHGVKETILATKLLKDAGFKVLYQMMPNLPGSNLKKDEKMFEELFQNPDFQPDLLKIYPCALLKEAPLYKWWKEGKYKPYTEKQLINLLKNIKKKIPYYVRIQRITRDIPSQRIIEGGAKISNLRQILLEKMRKEDWKCHCIRCREVREKYNPKEKIYLLREDYEASGGKEIFLSFENKNRTKFLSFLRLRIPAQCNENSSRYSYPVLKKAAIIREIQTFGEAVPIGERKIAPQHRGLGKKLIKEAEKIAKKELGLNKIAVISGVGARRYFGELGYKLEDTYMVKVI